MAVDLAAYDAVSGELEEAEREAGQRRLCSASGDALQGSGLASAAVLRWVQEYQAQRLLMHLMLLDVVDAVWDGEHVEFRLAGDVPVELRDKIDRQDGVADGGDGPAAL